MEPHDTIRQAIRERLEELGWSQAELGRQVGIHPVTLSRYMSGARDTLSPENIDRILTTLGLRIRTEKI